MYCGTPPKDLKLHFQLVILLLKACRPQSINSKEDERTLYIKLTALPYFCWAIVSDSFKSWRHWPTYGVSEHSILKKPGDFYQNTKKYENPIHVQFSHMPYKYNPITTTHLRDSGDCISFLMSFPFYPIQFLLIYI